MMIDTKGCLALIAFLLFVGFAAYSMGSMVLSWLV